MSTNFTVCSFNIGANLDDYQALCRHLDRTPPLPQPPQFSEETAVAKKQRKDFAEEERNAFQKHYDTAQAETAARISNLAQVYCFQEVKTTARPFMERFPANRFATIRFEGAEQFDTAVVLDRERFEDITNHSMSVLIRENIRRGVREEWRQDVAIASATDRLTGERVTFVSAHAPGFNYAVPNLNMQSCPDLQNGDIYCRAIAQRLSEIGNSAIQVIGTDMNANPERWNPRFEIFSDFQVNRNANATNVNPADGRYNPEFQEREIDFILTKMIVSFWQKIKAIFFSYLENTAAVHYYNPLTWDNETNCSDHLPVFTHVTSTQMDSKIYQLWCAISSCFYSSSAHEAIDSL